MLARTMPDAQQPETAPQSNLERLRAHLTKDSLAEKLVTARVGAGSADPRPLLRTVILDRVDELKRKHDSLPDQ